MTSAIRILITFLAVGLAPLPAQETPALSPAPSPPALPSPAPSPGDDPIASLDAAQLQKAIDVLRREHVLGTEIDEAALTRATLRGLLETLSPGAFLGGADSAPVEESPFRSEILDGRAGYVRLGSFRSENIAQLDAALRGFAGKKVHGVVLDLRATPDSPDFELAAQVAGRFCAPGTALFALSGPATKREFTASGETLHRGPLVVIIDERTAGAAEALAATLRWNARALLVGTRSSGKCVEFSTVRLGDGCDLRFASAEVRVAGQAIYPRGLRPDIEVAQEPEEREKIMQASLEKGMGIFVFEQQRAQFNEAALVAGTNPEINENETDRGLLDRPLQRAVDLVTAIRLFEKPSD